jgi:hypothetical protein
MSATVVGLLDSLRVHLTAFELPELYSVHVITARSALAVSAQLTCHHPPQIVTGLLAWADTLTDVTIAARCGVDAGSLQDRPHRARRNRVAKPSKFAVDPPVTQGEFSEASRRTHRRGSGAVGRPAVRRRGWVQCCLTRSRCHRKIVPSVTIRCSRQAWDSKPDQCREHRPIRPRQPRRPDLTTEHGDLVT